MDGRTALAAWLAWAIMDPDVDKISTDVLQRETDGLSQPTDVPVPGTAARRTASSVSGPFDSVGVAGCF